MDRRSARGIVLAVDALRATAAATLAILLTGVLPVPVTVVVFLGISLLNGCFGAVFMPAVGALLPRIVTGASLTSANALTQSSNQVCALLGLSLGGACSARWGAPTLALSFTVAALATLLVREPPRAAEPGETTATSHVQELRAGWAWLRQERSLRRLLATLAVTNLLFMPVYVLLPVYTRERLGAAPGWYGVLLASAAAGSLLGLASLSVSRPRRPTARPILVVGIACLAGAGIVGAGLSGLRGGRRDHA